VVCFTLRPLYPHGKSTWYSLDMRLGGLQSRSGCGGEEKNSHPLRSRVQNGSGAQPASYPMCSESSFPGVKRPGREADHSPPSSAQVKECVELYLHSPIRLHGVVFSLKKTQGQLYLYLYLYEMGGTCSLYQKDEKCIQNFSLKSKWKGILWRPIRKWKHNIKNDLRGEP
jgi:hypothetical protein